MHRLHLWLQWYTLSIVGYPKAPTQPMQTWLVRWQLQNSRYRLSRRTQYCSEVGWMSLVSTPKTAEIADAELDRDI
jgi:hypothetical protein